MGWRGQDNRDADEKAERLASLRSLPWTKRVAVHVGDRLIALLLTGMFVAMMWAVVRSVG